MIGRFSRRTWVSLLVRPIVKGGAVVLISVPRGSKPDRINDSQKGLCPSAATGFFSMPGFSSEAVSRQVLQSPVLAVLFSNPSASASYELPDFFPCLTFPP